MENELEVWKDVVENPVYRVSNKGQVFNTKLCRNLALISDTDGYLVVRLNQPRKLVKVHRLVAKAFISNPYNKPQVNHLDGIKTNNCIENLEWCTAQENISHAEANKLRNNAGENHPIAKLTEEDIKKIRNLILNGVSKSELASIFKVSRSTIGDIKAKRSWAHVS